MVKKFLLLSVSLVFHLLAIGMIIYLTWPIAKWYLGKVPARGVDLYLSVSYVSDLWQHFALPFNAWKEFWFSGVPYSKDYPSFYFYLMVPFASYFGLVRGVQMFAVVGLFVFATFSYLLYATLSQNRILAIILTLVTVFSANLYRSLVWAGGIPFWTTQAFFPIVLFLVVKYCQTRNFKWFLLGSLAAGLGIMGHPQSFLNVILPSAALILFFWQPKEAKFSFKKRILEVVEFGGLSYLISLPLISSWLPLTNLFVSIITLLTIVIPSSKGQAPASTGGSSTPAQTLAAIEAWTRSQFNLVWTDTNSLLWYFLLTSFALFLISLVLRKKRLKGIISFLPFGMIAGMVVGLVFLYSRGINLYITGWYKAFWPILVGVATLIAFLWGEAKEMFVEREFWQKRAGKFLQWLGIGAVNLALIGIGFLLLVPTQKTTIEKLEKIDNHSSAFPETLNARIDKENLLTLKRELKPRLMTDDPKDFRLYVIDATVNIWWGALEDVPLTRGYVDPPLTFAERWGLFWIDSALGPTNAGPKSSLIEDWKTPEEVADNNTYFLLDWYATKYLEGDHVSATNSHFAPNIITDKFIEAEEKIETKGGIASRYTPEEHWSDEQPQSLNFFRVKSNLVSPILTASNASPVLHVGGDDGYDTLIRLLGELNLGPRKVILARGPKFIDQLSFEDLVNFEALILYKYDYRDYDKAWGLIDKYVEKGGKVFVDTGGEVKESDTTKLPGSFPHELPGIFPIKRTIREDTGKYWEPEAASDVKTEGIDFTRFSPLIFDKGPWNVSHPISNDDLRMDSKVILKNKGTAVVAERTLGGGKLIWSGYNLPYHTIRDYNTEEGKFFKNLLADMVDLREKEVLAKGRWLSPRERTIESAGGKGVVFKEQAFDGWQANLGGRSLKIYKTGPSSPGFMYVRLPSQTSGQVKFKYTGSFSAKLYSAISVIIILLILDYLFGGRVFMPLIRRLAAPVRRRLGKWWAREDEY